MTQKIFNEIEINTKIINVPRGRCLQIFQEAIQLYNQKHEDDMTEEENDEMMEFYTSILQCLMDGMLLTES